MAGCMKIFTLGVTISGLLSHFSRSKTETASAVSLQPSGHHHHPYLTNSSCKTILLCSLTSRTKDPSLSSRVKMAQSNVAHIVDQDSDTKSCLLVMNLLTKKRHAIHG